jgi:superfamily II DNA or RNA helicase
MSSSNIVLRPYQQHALDGGDPRRGPGVIRCFKRHQRVLLWMAVGTGKTQTFLEAMRRYVARHGRRALVLSHRDELVEQPLERGSAAGMDFGREQAEFRSAGQPFVSASVQTMAARLDRFRRDEFGFIVVDEAHRSTAEQYRTVLDHFADAWTLGVTATPHRLDGVPLSEAGYSACGYSLPMADAIDEGWLVPVRPKRVTIDGVDLSQLRVRGGDFEPEALGHLMAENAHHVARHTVDLAGDRQTIVFCVNVAHAHAQAEALRRYTRARVEVVDGGTDIDRRRAIMAAYKRGEIRFLCNVLVATEGFDAQATSCVVMARPTRSTTIYTQCCGRGSRPLPGTVDGPDLHVDRDLRRAAIAASNKPDMLLLDIAGVGDELSLATMADALAGGLTAEQRAQLLQLEPDGEDTFDEMIAEAVRLAAVEEARKMEASRASASVVDSDPFSASNVLGFKEKDDPRAPRATPEQIAWLRKYGVQNPERLSAEAAAKAKKTICVRVGKGLCGYREMQTLQKYGVPPATTIRMSRQTAAELIAELSAARGRPARWDSEPHLGGRRDATPAAPSTW